VNSQLSGGKDAENDRRDSAKRKGKTFEDRESFAVDGKWKEEGRVNVPLTLSPEKKKGRNRNSFLLLLPEKGGTSPFKCREGRRGDGVEESKSADFSDTREGAALFSRWGGRKKENRFGTEKVFLASYPSLDTEK